MNKLFRVLLSFVVFIFIATALAAQGITASVHPFVNIRNSTGVTVAELFYTDSDEPDWGKNRISKPLVNNMPVQFTLEKTLGEARVYDFALKDNAGNMYAKYNVDVKSINAIVFEKSDLEKIKVESGKAGGASGGAGSVPAAGGASGKSAGGGMLPGISLSEKQVREALVASAKKYIGARYKYGAQSPPSAFDCSGFVSQAYRDVTGMVIPRSSIKMFELGIKINASSAQPGDVIVMDTENAGRPTHVALFVDVDTTIQALNGIKPPSVTQRGNPGLNKCRVLGYRTFVGWKQGNKQSYSPVGSTEFFIIINGDGARFEGDENDVSSLELNTTARFVFTNSAGKEGSFNYNFYREGSPRSEWESESFKLASGKKFESALCLAKSAGRYKLELFSGSKRIFECAWDVRK